MSTFLELKLQIKNLIQNMRWLIVAILLASLAIFLFSTHFMHEGIDHHIQQDMETMRSVVDNHLESLKDRLYQEVIMLSQSSELEKAFRDKNLPRLSSVAREAKERFKASFATITDENGVVLARGHIDKRGDKVESPLMVQALSGNPVVDVVKLRNNGLSVAAVAPVYIDNQIVGALLFGDAFRTHAFVDAIKQTTNLEMTIFDQDERLSTTIIRAGGRATGTRLENPKIYNILLEGGIYSDNAEILGKIYKTVYWPLRNKMGVTAHTPPKLPQIT
ncbi:MAG: cache domain-containing protein [Desulfovibrionaceae bacterium]|nr:cache domain-containing protein [Desulfovibrionaceae bacterium]